MRSLVLAGALLACVGMPSALTSGVDSIVAFEPATSERTQLFGDADGDPTL